MKRKRKIRNARGGVGVQHFGQANDEPVQGAFLHQWMTFDDALAQN